MLAPRAGWLRWALGAFALLAAIAAGSWLAAPWYVRTSLLPGLWAQYGLTVAAERQHLSLADGTARYQTVLISQDQEALLAAKHMELQVSLRGLYEGRTVFERVVFDQPVLHARVGADGRTNVGTLLGSRPRAHGASRGSAALWEEILIHGGTFEWDDPAQEKRIRIVDIEATALAIQTGGGERRERFGEVTLDGNLEQRADPAPLSIVCWTISSADEGGTFVLHAALTGIDLDSFPGYVDATQRSRFGVDHLDLVVSMEVRDGVIRRGAAVAVSPERTRPLTLLFGGPIDDPVLDRSSRLAALLELPFSRLGRLGDVVWETGGAVVGGAVGVIDGVVHGDLVGAGGAAVGGVGGGALALGSNVLDALEALVRGLGLVAPGQARDVATIHAHHRASFLSARREAAEAWSRAHPGTRARAADSAAGSGAAREAAEEN